MYHASMADRILKRKIDDELRGWLSSKYKECLVVKGARQIGKTFAIERFLKAEGVSFVKLDFVLDKRCRRVFEGDVRVDAMILKIRDLLGFKAVPYESVIFLDEIQACPAARTLLKAFVLDGRYRVIASGSLLGMSRYKADDEDEDEDEDYNPVGYEKVVRMHPLDFEEFLWAYGADPEVIAYVEERIRSKEPVDGLLLDSFSELFRLYVVVGGMPEAVTAYLMDHDVADARAVQKKIMEGYRDDVGKYAPQRIRDKVFAVFDSMPSQLAEENTKFRYSRIDAEFVPTYETYSTAINWLCDAMVAVRCWNLTEPKQPLKYKKRDNIFKVYMCDTGLLLSAMDDSVAKGILVGDARINKGGIGENIVAISIVRSGREPYYFATASMEVDFITVLGREVTAMEVKTGNNNRAKSLESVRDNYGVRRRMKFEKCNVHVSADGVEHYPLFAAAFIGCMAKKFDLRFEPDVPRLPGSDDAA